jgi:hypothetical protein
VTAGKVVVGERRIEVVLDVMVDVVGKRYHSSRAGPTYVRAAVKGVDRSVTAQCSQMARKRGIGCDKVSRGSTQSTRYSTPRPRTEGGSAPSRSKPTSSFSPLPGAG